jgi:hypothetical protein
MNSQNFQNQTAVDDPFKDTYKTQNKSSPTPTPTTSESDSTLLFGPRMGTVDDKNNTKAEADTRHGIVRGEEKEFQDKLKSATEQTLFNEELKRLEKNQKKGDYYVDPEDKGSAKNSNMEEEYLKQNWKDEKKRNQEFNQKLNNRKESEKYSSPSF